MKKNLKKDSDNLDLGGLYLLNMSKYKSGKKKGQYKYLKFVEISDWNKNAPRPTKRT